MRARVVHRKTNVSTGGTAGKDKLRKLWTPFLKHAEAATKVQAAWRGHAVRKWVAARSVAAGRIQAAWRRHRDGKSTTAAAVAVADAGVGESHAPRRSRRRNGGRV